MKRVASLASIGGTPPRAASARVAAGAGAPADGDGGTQGAEGAAGLVSPRPLHWDSENLMAGVDALPDELEIYLPQAVQALKAEQWPPSSALAHLLVSKGLQMPRTFGLNLFWLLQVEISREQDDAAAMAEIQNLLVRSLGMGSLGAQFRQQNALWSKSGFFARVVDTYMGRRDTAIVRDAEGAGGSDEEDESEEEMLDRVAKRRASVVTADDAAAALGEFGDALTGGGGSPRDVDDVDDASGGALAGAAAARGGGGGGIDGGADGGARAPARGAGVASGDVPTSLERPSMPARRSVRGGDDTTAGDVPYAFAEQDAGDVDAEMSSASAPPSPSQRASLAAAPSAVPGGERVLCIYKVSARYAARAFVVRSFLLSFAHFVSLSLFLRCSLLRSFSFSFSFSSVHFYFVRSFCFALSIPPLFASPLFFFFFFFFFFLRCPLAFPRSATISGRTAW